MAWHESQGARALLDQDLADAVEKEKLRNQFWVILVFLTVGKSPLRSSAPATVLKLENPELFTQPRKIFPVPSESGIFLHQSAGQRTTGIPETQNTSWVSFTYFSCL